MILNGRQQRMKLQRRLSTSFFPLVVLPAKGRHPGRDRMDSGFRRYNGSFVSLDRACTSSFAGEHQRAQNSKWITAGLKPAVWLAPAK
jgi:hypothetical protein